MTTSIALLIFLLGAAQAGFPLGCYREPPRHRHFNINPGDHRPEITTIRTCMAACGTFDYLYSATTAGKFCYCSNTLPDDSAKESDTNCNIPCAGDGSANCGGTLHVSVFKSSKPITGLAITSDVAVNTIISVNTLVTLDVTIDQGMDVIYSMDYDDGAGRSSPNATDMMSRTYYIPGEYYIQVYANDQNQTFQDVVAATAVRVDAPPGELMVECDPIFGTHEEGKCTLTAWSGSDLSFVVNVDTFSSTFTAEEPPLSLAGPGIRAKESSAGDDASANYLMIASEFSVSGKVLGWEMYVTVLGTGTLTIAIMEPSCAGIYCYSSNACVGGSCDSEYLKVTSCPSNPYCMQYAICSTVCSSPTSRYAAPPASYAVKSTVTVTVSNTGYQYIEEPTEVLVEPGDVMGLQHSSGNALLGRLSAETDEDDKQFASGTLGTLSYATGSATSVRHAIRAVASGGSKVHMPYTFVNPGNHTMTVTASSASLPLSSSKSTTAIVMVLEGVNFTIIDAPEFAKTGEVVSFTILPHTGNEIHYNWTFDSTNFFESLDNPKTFTFNSVGVFLVNVTTYNSVSEKNNYTWIQIEDELIGLTLAAEHTALGTPTEIAFKLTKGTNYSCDWDYGDGTSDTTDDISTPQIGATHPHLYASIGEYTVTVVCKNNVSDITQTVTFKVQEAITSLSMVREGANKNTDFYLEWQVATGTEITFDFDFGGNAITSFSPTASHAWKSDLQLGRAPVNIPITLKASNLVSNETINVNFVVLSVIVNPSFTTPLPNASSHTDLVFTADMDSGSDVTVTVLWGDGSQDAWIQPSGQEWSAPYDFTHQYHNGGTFNAIATFENKEGSYSETATVVIIVSVGGIDCKLVDYSLYHPPAHVNLTLEGDTLPTDPILYLNWGESHSTTLQPALKLNHSYSHTYGDTGEYLVNATITNFMGSKVCEMNLIVVEHLDIPSFQSEFPKAAIGMPYDVTFCLNRGPSGDLCNLTFEYGDGNAPQVYERTGSVHRTGQDGCDTQQVTYNSYGSKTIKVTAKSPLEEIYDTENVEVIDGISESSVTVNPVADKAYNAPSIFSVSYTGSPSPNNPRIKFIYGDNGITEEDDAVFTSPATQNHVYSEDGLFNATVILYNDATRVEINVTVGVYKDFINLQPTVYFLKEHPPGEKDVDGYNDADLYPQNKPIYFSLATDNNAYAESYTVTLTDGDGVNTQIIYTVPVFAVNFPKVSSYTVSVVAYNPMYSETITRSVNMLELIEGMEVTEVQPQVGVNEPKTFNISFEAVGSGTCVYVHFKTVDRKEVYETTPGTCSMTGFTSLPAANKHPISATFLVEHIYTLETYYEIEVIAKNAQSEEKKVVGFTITGLDCSKPSVDIFNRKNYFTNPEHFKRSSKIQIRGLSNIQCANSYDNTKYWWVEKMDESYDTHIGTVDLSSLETSKAELNFPPRFLDLGLYRVHYEMTMAISVGGNSSFKSTTYTYINVDPSDIIGVMVKAGVTEITRGQLGGNLVLEPLLYSYDPDVEPLPSPQGLKVKSWKCHIKGDSTPGNCGGFQDNKQDKQTLDLSQFTVDKTYQVTAEIVDTPENRSSTTDVFVVVVAGNPPSVTIVPREGSVYYQQSDGYRILQTSRFSMKCVCDTCGGADSLTYQWSLYLDDYRWDDGWRPLEEADTDNRVLGRQSEEISIEASLFATFDAKIMKVQCELVGPTGKGSVATRLMVNSPPTSGTCSVTPLNRTYTPDKVWTIEVDGWEDEDGLDKYQFFIHTSEDEVDRQITSVDIIDPKMSIQVSLSEGYDFNDFKQDVIISVYDKLGAVNKVKCDTVEVRPMPLDNVQALLNNILNDELNDLNKLFAEGDQKDCTEKMTSIFSTLNSAIYAGYRVASNYDGSMYGQMDVGRPSYQQTSELLANDEEGHYNMESNRDGRSKTRSSIIANLATLPAESMTAVVQLTNALNQACQFGDEIVQNTQETIMDSMENMTDFMLVSDNLVDVPPEEIESAMENGIATIGNIMSASGGNGFFGTLQELDDTKEDETFSDYDASSDMAVDLEMEQAADFEAALRIHKARIHKRRQEATAKRVRRKTTRCMDKFAKIYGKYSVPGQTLQLKSLKMRMAMEKTQAKSLEGKTLDIENSVGGATLPNISSLLPNTGSDTPVVLSVSQTTNHPLRYSKAAEAISSSTNFIHVNIYNDDNTKLAINGLAEPVKVVVPRDSNAEVPSYIAMDPKIPSWSNLMNFVVTINRTSSAVFMDFDDIKGRQFLLVVKKGESPKIVANSSEDVCDSVHLMPSSMDQHKDSVQDDNKYRFIMSSAELGSFTGRIFIGVRELNSTEYDMDISQGCDSLPRYENGSDYFRGDFLLRQYVSQCLAIDDSQDDWTTDGCYVGVETQVDRTVCYCNHLTTFAGGWVVVPNTIDWSYVFANADFLSNPTIYITQIVIVVCFIVGVIYARIQDKKMAEKLGLAPLADNDPKDKYFYEIIVCTGMRRNAGTNSQVCFILSGEDDETDIRAFSDSKRKIFKRGQIDGFLMTVPRCLGYLNFMRIWHDNAGKGKFGSWYLNYVIVRDVQTGDKQVFVANKWLAVEEDDGQVDRVIPVAGREQLADFSYQFGERTRKNLADGHLWFSVVARPPQSRFTCVQRVCCILCLLYVTMLANAMFYKTAPQDEQTNNAFNIGPFSVSPEQLFIGVISNLIVFPVNFLLVFLFRKSRPHHKRPSRIDRAIQENNEQIKQACPNDVKPEVSSIFSVSKSPTIPHDPHRPDTAGSRPATAMSMGSNEEGIKKKKKFELPWFFVIIAWILLIVVTLGAGAMVTFYGISFQDETCKKWISSMLVSFFMSVFITQPIKVFLFAVILSIIIKNPSEEKEDEEDDEEVHQSNSMDNDLLHQDDGFGATRPRKIGYKPPDPALLEKYRQKRLKEIKMWGIVREVIVYVFFLWILLVISYRQLGPANFLYKNTMHRVFIENNDTKINFNALRNTEEFWHWAKSGLVNGIRAGSYYNDYPPLKLRSFVNDKVSRILGYATMRQLRVKPALCEIPDVMEEVIDQCNAMYHILDQDEGSFMPGWRPFASNETLNDTRKEYTYTKADTLNGYPYWGTLAWYSGGGYVVPLVGSKKDLIGKMDELQRENWIDKYTRGIFVEFTVYNPQVNLFAINTILAEFHPSGGLVQSFRFEPAMLLPYMDSAMLFQLIIQGVFVAFTLFFIVREMKELIRTRLSYFKSFWNLVEIGIIGMSVAAIVIYFYRLFVTLDLTDQFKSTKGNGYVKFQYVGYWNEMLSYMIGFLVYLASLKFLKLLRFNKKITLLSATLHHSARSLLHFSIIYAIVFLAFAQLFYLTYMNIDIAYSTFVNSVVASVLMMMGKFNIYTMIMKEPVLTQVFVLLFVVTVTFIMVNMFISILNETFTVVREDINKQGNDYEIVDFMVNSFRKWTGIGGVPQDHDVDPDEWNNRKNKTNRDPNADPDCVDDFPDRIDRLLQSISAVYTDNDNFAKMYNKKPYQSGQRDPKSMLRQGRSPSPAPGHFSRKDSSDALAKVHTH